MENFKELKKKSKVVLKRHYINMVALLVLAGMLGSSFTGMLMAYRFRTSTLLAQISARSTKGVFSELLNMYSSGSILASIAKVIMNAIEDPKVVNIIFMVLALGVIFVVTVFVSETYRIVYTRAFLECRIYDRVGTASITYLPRVRRWKKVSLSYLRVNMYSLLWWLTIAGGVIKHYSYCLARYILAENPEVSGKDAIALSRKMMDGHKWEMVKLDLTFIGWDLLSTLTGGLLSVFFVAPYKETVRAEYYVAIREGYLKKDSSAKELLNDTYLYEAAPKSKVDDAYKDVIKIMEEPEIELRQPSKVRAFFQDVFGVVLRYDKEEMLYRKKMTAKSSVLIYRQAVDGEAYPYRLNPVAASSAKKTLEHQLYMRHYSVPSLILIFFSFAFVGWIWEVSIHIVNDGRFVNRGVMHGPWLPIYGFGAIFILTVLNKFRKKPLVEFLSAIALCGVVEYTGSFMLEKVHDGTKWWDYTGYLLNLNGRICAEGLLVFGLAGVAAVYFLAPILDNNFARINHKVKNPLCAVLMTVFIVDCIYSHFVPNTGEGITDYGEAYEVENLSESPL